uniref:Uncharacterized protein n=1 Tax=Siphoviridae sp. ctNHj22 TaxID=2825468 RepID=A0A8S5VFJ8_9CAUD|nr:MAG TPA: hypothetical protein [Siphoviridae sp. ctNHj22]
MLSVGTGQQRFAGCFYARFWNGSIHRAAALSVRGWARTSLSAWFDSTVSHQMAHGLIPHKAARLTSRATRESFESLRVWVDFPTGCASNNSPGGEPGLFYMAA